MKDPYVYDGTTILINNFGLKDQIALDKMETIQKPSDEAKNGKNHTLNE